MFGEYGPSAATWSSIHTKWIIYDVLGQPDTKLGYKILLIVLKYAILILRFLKLNL